MAECNPYDLITLDEPKMLVWNGVTCQNPDDDGYRHLAPGSYNCDYGLCDNTQNVWNDAIDGVWVPPNMYAWMWNDRQEQIGGLSNAVIQPEILTKSWREENSSTMQTMSDPGFVVAKIISAKYHSRTSNNGFDVTNNQAVKNMLGQYQANISDCNAAFGDPDPGQPKQLDVTYQIGTGIPFANYRPDGVYGPGFYTTLQSQKGAYDDNPHYLPDAYSNKGGRAAINAVDTIVLNRSRPWKDHLRECCFQTGDSPIGADLCGEFDGKTDAGRKECKSFLTECSADEIKLGGRCHDLCASNPEECDKIKEDFCTTHPDDPFCDCINYTTRQEWKDYVTKFPLFTGTAPTCTYSRCRGVDQEDVFLTQAIKQEATEKCPDINEIDNDINGNNNMIALDQSIVDGKSKGLGATGGGNSETQNHISGNNNTIKKVSPIKALLTPINVLIFFIVLIFFGVAIYYFAGSDEPDYLQQNYGPPQNYGQYQPQSYAPNQQYQQQQPQSYAPNQQ